MVHGKREFQRVVEDMLVIRNPQIVMIDLIGGNTIQFIQDLSFGPRHLQCGAQPPPSNDA